MHFEEYITQVIELVRVTLKEEDLEVEDITPLLEIKGFDSLTIVSLLERVENQLGIEMNSHLILPETFTNSRTLVEALLKSKDIEEARKL